MNRVKIIFIICALCFSCVLSTKAQKVFSLNSLFTEQDAVLIPKIEGYWTFPVFDWTMSVKKAGDNFYHFNYDIDNSEAKFEAVFMKIKGEIFLDLKGIFPDNIGDTDYRDSFLPGHSIYKIKILDNSITISSLNYSWFYNHAVKGKLPVKFEWINNGMLLTFSTDELKSFLAENILEDGFFSNPDTLVIENKLFHTETDTTTVKFATTPSVSLSQSCVPKFPFKDGWLGGDGDVSAAINDTTTIWIFSDTYVGKINQQSRQEQGMRMVSNTVSIQTCMTDGETKVNYYWNKMYSDNPEPFFRSFTDRYKYWVVDAFMANSNLYVILSKIGPKFGSVPGDIFNFSGLGFTLAKISNPYEIPAKWKIELLPLPEFKSSTMELSCHAKQDGYIYFFVNRHDKEQALVRKNIKLIDNPNIQFEYYAKNDTWKDGLKYDDMKIVIDGFRGNTVKYHSELNKWVMISDIWFMDNKIKMRTSRSLTGPWSDEVVVYEIPEVTPGDSLYSKSNFCYLAREHIQYYDPENREMLLTYDINNTSYSEILSNPKIYTPKVIRILLNKNGSR